MLQAVAERLLVLLQAGQLLVVDARRSSVETLRGQACQLGDDLVDRARIVDDLAFIVQLDGAALAGKALGQPAGLPLLLEVELHDGILVRRGPVADAIELLGRRGGLAEEANLDRPLDGALARLVRTAHDVEPGRQLERQVGVALDVA